MKYINPFDWQKGFYIPTFVAKLDIPASAKLIYGILARYAKKEGYAWPMQQTIASNSGLSLIQTKKMIKRLVEERLIKVETPTGKARMNHKSARYYFLNDRTTPVQLEEPDSTQDTSRSIVPDTSGDIAQDTSIISNTQKDLNTKDINCFSKEKQKHSRGNVSGVGLKLRKGARTSDKIRSKAKTLDRKRKEEVVVSKRIQEYIDMWEAKGFMVSGRTTKTFKHSVDFLKQLVRGTFFDNKPNHKEFQGAKLDLATWEKVLDRYEKMFSVLYLPSEKGWLRMSLNNFIWNSFAKNGSMSLFYQLLTKEPELINETKYPKLTNQIIKQFGTMILKEKNYTPDDTDLSNFILAGNKCGDYFDGLKKKGKAIIPHIRVTNQKRAEWLINSILKDTENKYTVITSGWLCSKRTIEYRLPTYMIKQELLTSISPLRRR